MIISDTVAWVGFIDGYDGMSEAYSQLLIYGKTILLQLVDVKEKLCFLSVFLFLYECHCATLGTEIVGTLVAVYGLFVTPIGWQYALYIWLYAGAWFVINDVIKMSTYRIIRDKPESASG